MLLCGALLSLALRADTCPLPRFARSPRDNSLGTGGESAQFFTEWEESFDSFDQMGLHENLLRGIYAYGEPAHARGARSWEGAAAIGGGQGW